MSTYNKGEVPAAYAALDSAFFQDGMAMDTHGAAVITDNANFQLGTEAQILQLPWPRMDGDVRGTTAEDWDFGTYADHFRTWVPTNFWMPLTGVLPMPKPPGPTRGEVRVRARVSDSHVVMLQFATRASPFDPNAGRYASNVLLCLGDNDNDVDPYSFAYLPLLEDRGESLQIYAKAAPTNDAPTGNDGNRGYDNRTDSPGTNIYYEVDRLLMANSGWIHDGYPRAGAEIEIRDAGGDAIGRWPIIAAGLAADPASGNALRFLQWFPPLAPQQQQDANAGDDWQIYALPNLSLASVTIGTVAL